jgi:hypothetical protein
MCFYKGCRAHPAVDNNAPLVSVLRYQLPASGSYAVSVFVENWFDDCGVDANTHSNDGIELRINRRRPAGASAELRWPILSHSTNECWIDPGSCLIHLFICYK